MEYGKKPCLRCLLTEAGERELSAVIAERIAVIPAEQKTDDALYRQRLDICRSCDMLVSGTCRKCGCYVELRAARKNSACPHEKKYW